MSELQGNCLQTEHQEIVRKVESINNFAVTLLDNIEDLDPEFSKVIDENYWELI